MLTTVSSFRPSPFRSATSLFLHIAVVAVVACWIPGCSGGGGSGGGGAPGENTGSGETGQTGEDPVPGGNDGSGSGPTDLTVVNAVRFPTRLALESGKTYVTDALVGSTFIYDIDLKLNQELKNLDRPLGIVVSNQGDIYVGNDGRDNVEVYSSLGEKRLTIPGVTMPNDLALDKDGLLYVADSESDVVRVFDRSGAPSRTIGAASGDFGGLGFPNSLVIGYRPDPNDPGGEIGELFVTDQDASVIQVFSLGGAHLRTLGSRVPAFSQVSNGKFVRLQGLALDSTYRLHVLDCYLNQVQVLNATTGEYIADYGGVETDPERLRLPMDIAISADDKAIVTNSESASLRLFADLP